jgi:hypothetical protein
MTWFVCRNEAVHLADQLHDLKAKAKLWATPTRMAAHAEAKILLTKVDAVQNQISLLESNSILAQKQIKALQDSKRELQAQMGLMVPLSDLNASQSEAGKLREAINDLRRQLLSKQGEIDTLTNTMQACRRMQRRFFHFRLWLSS